MNQYSDYTSFKSTEPVGYNDEQNYMSLNAVASGPVYEAVASEIQHFHPYFNESSDEPQRTQVHSININNY